MAGKVIEVLPGKFVMARGQPKPVQNKGAKTKTRNIVVFDPDSTINSVKRGGEEVYNALRKK